MSATTMFNKSSQANKYLFEVKLALFALDLTDHSGFKPPLL